MSGRGERGHRSVRGERGHRSAHGERGHRSARGERGNRSRHGERGISSCHGERGNSSGRGDRGIRSSRGERGIHSRGRIVQQSYHQPRIHRERTDQFHDNRTERYHGEVAESNHATETEHYHDHHAESYHGAETEHYHGETHDRFHGDSTERYDVGETEPYYSDRAESYVDETEHYYDDSAENYHDPHTETYYADNADSYCLNENDYYQSGEIDNYHSERPLVTHGDRTHSEIIPENVYSESGRVYEEEYIHHHGETGMHPPADHRQHREHSERRKHSHERRTLLGAPDSIDVYNEHDTQIKERRTLLDDRMVKSVSHSGQSHKQIKPRKTLLGGREDLVETEPEGHYSDIVDSAYEQFVDLSEHYETVDEYSEHQYLDGSALLEDEDRNLQRQRPVAQDLHLVPPQQFPRGRGKPNRGQHSRGRSKPTRGQHPRGRSKPSRGQHSGERVERPRGQHSGERDERPRGQHSSERVERPRGQHSGERDERPRGQHSGERDERPRGQHSGDRDERPRGQHSDNRVEGPRGQHPDERVENPREKYPPERGKHPRDKYPPERGKSSRGAHASRVAYQVDYAVESQRQRHATMPELVDHVKMPMKRSHDADLHDLHQHKTTSHQSQPYSQHYKPVIKEDPYLGIEERSRRHSTGRQIHHKPHHIGRSGQVLLPTPCENQVDLHEVKSEENKHTGLLLTPTASPTVSHANPDDPVQFDVPFQTGIMNIDHPEIDPHIRRPPEMSVGLLPTPNVPPVMAEHDIHTQKQTWASVPKRHPKKKSRVSRGLLPTPEIQTDVLPLHMSDKVTTPRVPPCIPPPVATHEDNSRTLPDNLGIDSLVKKEVVDKTDHFVPFESGLMNLNHPRWAERSATSDNWERFEDGSTSHQDKSFDDLLRSVPSVTASETENQPTVALDETSSEDASVLIANSDAMKKSAASLLKDDSGENIAQMVQQYKLHVELTKALEGMQKTMQTLNEKIRKTPKTKAPKKEQETHQKLVGHTKQEEIHPLEIKEETFKVHLTSKADNSHKQEDTEGSVAKQKDDKGLVVKEKDNDDHAVKQEDVDSPGVKKHESDESVNDMQEQDTEENPEQISDTNNELPEEEPDVEQPGTTDEPSTALAICDDSANMNSGKYKSHSHVSDTAGEQFGLGAQTEYKTYREWRLAKQRMDRYFSSDNDSAKEYERDGRQASGYDKPRRNDRMPESSRRIDHRNRSGERQYGSTYQRNDSERRSSNDQFPGQRSDTYSGQYEDNNSGRRNQRSSSSTERDHRAKRKDNATMKSPNHCEDHSKQHQSPRATERPYYSSSFKSPDYYKNQDKYRSDRKIWEHDKNAPNRNKSPEDQTKDQSRFRSSRGSDHHRPHPSNTSPEDHSRDIDRQESGGKFGHLHSHSLKRSRSPEQHKVSHYREKNVPGYEHENKNKNIAKQSEMTSIKVPGFERPSDKKKEDKLAKSDKDDDINVEEDCKDDNLFMKFSVNPISDEVSQIKPKVIKGETSDNVSVHDTKNVTIKLSDVIKGKSGKQQQETKQLGSNNKTTKVRPQISKSNLPTSKSANPDRENIFEKLSETLSSSSAMTSSKNVTSKREEKTHSYLIFSDSSSDDSEDVFEKINSILTKDKRKQKTFTVGPNKSHMQSSSISKYSTSKSSKETPAPLLIVTDSNTSMSDTEDKLKLASAPTNTKKKEFVKYLRRVNKTLFWKNHELKPLKISLQRLSKDDIYKLKKQVRKDVQHDRLKSLATKVSVDLSTTKSLSQDSKEQKTASVSSGNEKMEHVSKMKQKIKLPDKCETKSLVATHKSSEKSKVRDTSLSAHGKVENTSKPIKHIEQNISKPEKHKEYEKTKHVKHKEYDKSKHVIHNEYEKSKHVSPIRQETSTPSSNQVHGALNPSIHTVQDTPKPLLQETTLPVCEVSVQIVSDEEEEECISNKTPTSEGSKPSTTESKPKSDSDKNTKSDKYRRLIVPIPSASENSESDIERTVLVSNRGKAAPVISDSEDSEEFEGSLGSEEDISPGAACDSHGESEATETDGKITTNFNTGNVERGNSAINDMNEDILSEGTSGRNIVSLCTVDYERRIKPNKAKSLFKSPSKSRTFPQLDGHSDPLYEISGESSGDEGDVEDNSDDDIFASQDLFADIDDRNKYLITPGISTKAPCLSKNDKDGVGKHRSSDDQDLSVSPEKNTVTFFTKSQKIVEADDSTNEGSGTPIEEENEGTAPVKDEPNWLLNGYTQEPDTIFLSDDDEMTMSYSQPVILVSDEDSEDEIPVVTGIKKVKKESFDDQATQQLFGDSSTASEDWSDKGSDFEPESLFRNFKEITKCNMKISSDQRSIGYDSNVTTDGEEYHLSKEVKKESNSEAGIDFESSDEAVMSVNEDFLSLPKKIKQTSSVDIVKKTACYISSDDDELLAIGADSIEKKLGKESPGSSGKSIDIKTSIEPNTKRFATGLIKDENNSSDEHSSNSQHHGITIPVRKKSKASTGSSYSQYEEMTPMTPYIQETQVDPEIIQGKSSKVASVFDFHSEPFSDISNSTANHDKNQDEWSDDSDIMILDHSFDTENRKNDVENSGRKNSSLYDAMTQVGNLNTSVSASDLDRDDEMYEAMTQIDALESRLKKKFEERLNTEVDDISEAEDAAESLEDEEDIYEQQTQAGPSAEDIPHEKGSKGAANGDYDIQTQVEKPWPHVEDISDFDESGKSSVVDEFEEQTQVDTAGPNNVKISAVFEDITDEDSETQPYDDPQFGDYFQETQADTSTRNVAANYILGVKYDQFSAGDSDTPDENVYNVDTQVDEHNASTSTIDNEDYNETTLVDDSSVQMMHDEYSASTQVDSVDNDIGADNDGDDVGDDDDSKDFGGEEEEDDDDNELPDIESDNEIAERTKPSNDHSVSDPFVAATQIDIQHKPSARLNNKLMTRRLARKEGYGKTDEHRKVAFSPHVQDEVEKSDDNRDIYQFATQIDVIGEVENKSSRNKSSSSSDKSRVKNNNKYFDDFNAATQVDIGPPEIENGADSFYTATKIDDFNDVDTGSPEMESNDADCYNMETQIDDFHAANETDINSPEIENNDVDDFNMVTQIDDFNAANEADINPKMENDDDCFYVATQIDEVIDLDTSIINLDTSSSADNEVVDKTDSASHVELPQVSVNKAKESLTSAVKHTMERESSVSKTDVPVRSVLKRPNPDGVPKTVTFGHYGEASANKKPRIAPESTRQILPTVPQRMKTIKEKRNSGVRITPGSSKPLVPVTVPSSDYDSPFELEIIDASSKDMWLSKRTLHSARVPDKGKASRCGKRTRQEDPMVSLKAKMQAAKSQLRKRAIHTVSQPEAACKRMKKTIPEPSTELDDVTLPTDSQIVGQGLPILNPVGILKKGHKSGVSHHGETSHVSEHCVVSTPSSSISSTTITPSSSTSTSVITSSVTSSTCRSSISARVPHLTDTSHTCTSSVDKTQKIVDKTNDTKVSKSAKSGERRPSSDKREKSYDNVNERKESKSAKSSERRPSSEKREKSYVNVNGAEESKSSERRPSSDKREKSYDNVNGAKDSKSSERRPSSDKREKSYDNERKESKSVKSGEKRPSRDRNERSVGNDSERKDSKTGERRPSSDKRETSVDRERESKSVKSKERRPSSDKREKTAEKVDERKIKRSANTADAGQDKNAKQNENSSVAHAKKVNDKVEHSSATSRRSDKENRERSSQKRPEERSYKENKERSKKALTSTEDKSHRSKDDKQRSDKTKTSSRTSDSTNSRPNQDSRNTVNHSKSVTIATDCSSSISNVPCSATCSSIGRNIIAGSAGCNTMTTESMSSRPSKNSTSSSVRSSSFKPSSSYSNNKSKDFTQGTTASSGTITASVAMSIRTTVCTNSRTTVTMSAASTKMSVKPSTSTHIQSSVLLQKQRNQGVSTSVSTRPVVTASTSRQPFQTIPSNVPPVAMETLPYNMVDRSTPLQWHDFLKVLLRWNPLWLQEKDHFEKNNQRVPMPPITNDLCGHNNHTLYPLVPRYENYKEYSEKFMLPLLLHETWESCYSTWRQNKTHNQLIEHEVCYIHRTPPKNELTTYTLLGIISEQDRWKRRFVSEGELVKICVPGVEKISETKTKETKRDMMGFVDAIIFKDSSVNRIVSHFKCLGENRKGLRDCLSIKILVTVRNRAFEPSPTEIIHIQSISPIVNTYRQYNGLSSLPRSPLCQSILYPTNNMTYCDKAPPMVQNQENKMYNESQSVAINTAVRVCGLSPDVPRVCLLQGPPGTGKSHTIVGIVGEILKVKKAPFRVCLCAQSNAAVDELLRRLIYKDPAKKKSNINIVRLGKPTSVHKEIQDICLDKLVDKNLKRVRREKILEKLPKSLQTGILAVKHQISALKNDLKSASQLQSQKLMIDLKAKEKELERLESKCQVPQNMPIDRAEEGKMRRELLLRAQVVAGTLSSIGLEIIRSCFQGIKQAFHVAIIDEATQAIELETLIPLQYGVSKLILVGDPQQLPPTVVSQVAAEHNLNLSLFERLDSHFRSTQINPVILLDTQYRMNTEIALFPNEYVYSGKLKNDRSVMEKRKCNLAPYIVFNLSEGRELFSQGTRSMSNVLEAEFTAELCEMIVSEKTFRAREIGVIAPYAKQKTKVQQLLTSKNLTDIEVSTVDGFQGREKNVIIMTCVRANMSGAVGFVGKRSRMNVALTRARYAMYLVGNVASLESSDEWRVLIDDARKRGKIVSVDKYHFKDSLKKAILTKRK